MQQEFKPYIPEATKKATEPTTCPFLLVCRESHLKKITFCSFPHSPQNTDSNMRQVLVPALCGQNCFMVLTLPGTFFHLIVSVNIWLKPDLLGEPTSPNRSFLPPCSRSFLFTLYLRGQFIFPHSVITQPIMYFHQSLFYK